MIINHSLRMIFISNPKTGTKSIEASLENFQDEPRLDEKSMVGLYTKHHIPAVTLKKYIPEDVWKNYFKFSFVRNPWDWFISQHFYNLEKLGKLEKTYENIISVKDILYTYEFLKQYRGVEGADSGFQHSWVCDKHGRCLVDFLGRFEHLEEHFEIVQNKFGIRVKLPHINKSKHYKYKSYYSEETKSLIGRLYKHDICIFGYSF